MLHDRDIAFAGTDLLEELHADNVVPYFNTGLDPVRVVVAAPENLLVDGKLPRRHLRIATEYVVRLKCLALSPPCHNLTLARLFYNTNRNSPRNGLLRMTSMEKFTKLMVQHNTLTTTTTTTLATL